MLAAAKAPRRARRSPLRAVWAPTAGQAGARLASTVTPVSPSLLGCWLAMLGPFQVSYTLLVKGTSVICGAGTGTLVTLT